ncbi:MAG: hypothetical protein H7330_02090 [Hymenobacteraceae bacterium]|nr:hypothetical protein [Hymenobacteraceae bacterium]
MAFPDSLLPEEFRSPPAARPPDNIVIEFRPESRVIAVRWAGSCALAQLRDVYQQVGDLLVRTQACCVLFDTRERDVIADAAARWGATEGYATLLDAHTTSLRLAYVAPQTVVHSFGEAPLENLSEQLQIGVFLTPDAALAWLLRS